MLLRRITMSAEQPEPRTCQEVSLLREVGRGAMSKSPNSAPAGIGRPARRPAAGLRRGMPAATTGGRARSSLTAGRSSRRCPSAGGSWSWTWGPGRGCAAACSRRRWARKAVLSVSRSRPRWRRWRASGSPARAGVTSRSWSRRPRMRRSPRPRTPLSSAPCTTSCSPRTRCGNVMTKLRPGAWVAAGGGKWAAPWLMAVNLQARMLPRSLCAELRGFRPAVESSGAADRGRAHP